MGCYSNHVLLKYEVVSHLFCLRVQRLQPPISQKLAKLATVTQAHKYNGQNLVRAYEVRRGQPRRGARGAAGPLPRRGAGEGPQEHRAGDRPGALRRRALLVIITN